MSPGFRYGLGSVGVLLLLFGVFLAWWQRADHPGAQGRTRTGAWFLLLAGGALLAAALLVPGSASPPVPPFLLK